ncbi:MAG: nuclear transport factor 2 family protein [Nitrospirales bacterium]|nr:nuclear transport factor 2 family protein [Nitrospirales bacterium]
MKVNAPQNMHAAFAEAFNAGKIDDLLALYESDAVLVPQPGQQVVGRSGIREALLVFLDLKGRMQIETLSCFQTGDLALLQASWRMTATGLDNQPIEFFSHTAEVVRKQPDGSWLYVIDNAFAAA